MPHAFRFVGIAMTLAALCGFADPGAAFAAKIKMAFPGPATTFGLPLYVAQKKGWLGDLEEATRKGDGFALKIDRTDPEK